MSKESQFIYSHKNSFSAGELTPLMDGRTDLGLYQNGVKKLINFFCLPSGGVMRRHGTEYVALLNDDKSKGEELCEQNEEDIVDKIINNKTSQQVLLPFVINRDISFLIVFEIYEDHTNVKAFANGLGKPIHFGKLDFSFNVKNLSYCVDREVCYISFGIDKSVYRIVVNQEFLEKFEQTHDLSNQQQSSQQLATSKESILIIEPFEVLGKSYDQNLTFNDVMSSIDDFDMSKINEHINDKPKEEFNSISCKSLIVFNRRLWCLGLRHNIHGILASYAGRVNEFNVAYSSLLEARNPLSAMYAQFLSGKLDSILWAITFAKELIIATSDGIYILSEGDRVKGEYIKVHKEIDISISKIKPVMINKTIFFVGGDNRQVHSLYYSREKGGYQTSTLNVYAEHLFELGIRSIVGVESPFNMLVAVLNNGSFAAFIYDQELKLMGWSEHWLGGNGFIRDAAVIPKKDGDKIYFLVSRDSEGCKKEFLEFLDCKYLTANYSTTPHELMYIDCYYHVLRDVDVEIDDAFKQIFKYEHDSSNVKTEQLIIDKFCESSINFDENYIKENFCIGGVLFNKLLSEQSAITCEQDQLTELIKLTREYFAHYRKLHSSLLGLMYGFYKLCKQNLDLLNFDSIVIFSYSPTDWLKELEDITQNAIRIVSEISNWDLSSIKRTQLFTKDIYHTIDKRLYFSFLNIEQLKNVDKHFICLLDQLKVLNEVKKKQESGSKFESQLNNDSKQFLANLNKEFLYSKAINKVINNDSNWINSAINTHLFLTKDINTQENTLFKDLLLKQIIKMIDGGFKSNEDVVVWVRSVFPVIMCNIIHGYITNLQDCFFTYKEEITTYISVVFEKVINMYDLLAYDAPSNKSKDEQNNFIVKLITDLMNDYSPELEEMFEKLQSAVIPENQQQEQLEDSLPEGQQVQDQGIQDHKTEDQKIDWILGWYLDISKDERSIEELRQALNREAETHNLSGSIYSQILYLKVRDINILLDLFKNAMSELYKNSIKFEGRENVQNSDSSHMHLFSSNFTLWRKLFPDIDLSTVKSLLKLSIKPENHNFKYGQTSKIFDGLNIVIIGDEEVVFEGIEKPILYNPVHFMSLGFKYRSYLETFPFVFADEYEHTHKLEATLGLKVYNTKGGYILIKNNENQEEKYEIVPNKFDIRSLNHYKTDRKYLIKETIQELETPYITGWVDFAVSTKIDKDISMKFIIDKPYPVTLLKAYVKAKPLNHYI